MCLLVKNTTTQNTISIVTKCQAIICIWCGFCVIDFFFLRWQIFTISKSIISSNTFMVFGHTADFYLTHDLASIIQIHNCTSAIYLSICKTANCPPFFLLNIVIRPSLWKWLSICVKEPRSCFHTSIRWCDNHFCGKSNILWNVLRFFSMRIFKLDAFQ